MRLNINTAGVQFLATRLPEPRTDRDTALLASIRRRGCSMFQVQVAALDSSGGEVLAVSVPGQPSGITIGAPVTVEGLSQIPWSQGDRSGVAYRHRPPRRRDPPGQAHRLTAHV